MRRSKGARALVREQGPNPAHERSVSRDGPCEASSFASTLTACREPKMSLGAGPRAYTPEDYPDVLKRWTRTQQLFVFSKLDEVLTTTATYESWDFRWAYIVRYADDYRLTVEQRRVLLDKTLAETQETHRFYVAMYGAAPRRSLDLTKPESAWVVRLVDDRGSETAPAKVDAIRKPGPLEETYFPYTTGFRYVFRISFPTMVDGKPTISESAQWLGLRFAGPQGNEELRWLLEPGSPRNDLRLLREQGRMELMTRTRME
jgi:hypothetical protein